MAKFKVTMSSITLYEAEIEAENEDEARLIASEMDGGDFDEVSDSGDWEFHDVIEMSEAMTHEGYPPATKENK